MSMKKFLQSRVREWESEWEKSIGKCHQEINWKLFSVASTVTCFSTSRTYSKYNFQICICDPQPYLFNELKRARYMYQLNFTKHKFICKVRALSNLTCIWLVKMGVASVQCGIPCCRCALERVTLPKSIHRNAKHDVIRKLKHIFAAGSLHNCPSVSLCHSLAPFRPTIYTQQLILSLHLNQNCAHTLCFWGLMLRIICGIVKNFAPRVWEWSKWEVCATIIRRDRNWIKKIVTGCTFYLFRKCFAAKDFPAV
jgi:hypothetical protein